MSYITFIDLPPIPAQLKQDLLDWHKVEIYTKKYNAHYTHPSEESLGVGTLEYLEKYGHVGLFTYYKLSENLENQVYEHITKYKPHIKDHIREFGLLNITGAWGAPHTDCYRSESYTLNYVIDTGGDDVETIFYHPKQEYSHLAIEPSHFPYHILDPVEHYHLSEDTWHFLNGDVIHSIERITNLSRLILSGVYYGSIEEF